MRPEGMRTKSFVLITELEVSEGHEFVTKIDINSFTAECILIPKPAALYRGCGLKKEAGHSRLADCSLTKDGIAYETCLRWMQDRRPNLSLNRVLSAFSHVHRPDGFHTALFSQGYVLGTVHSLGMVGREYIPKTREGGEELLTALVQVTWWSRPPQDLLQQCTIQP